MERRRRKDRTRSMASRQRGACRACDARLTAPPDPRGPCLGGPQRKKTGGHCGPPVQAFATPRTPVAWHRAPHQEFWREMPPFPGGREHHGDFAGTCFDLNHLPIRFDRHLCPARCVPRPVPRAPAQARGNERMGLCCSTGGRPPHRRFIGHARDFRPGGLGGLGAGGLGIAGATSDVLYRRGARHVAACQGRGAGCRAPAHHRSPPEWRL
jgi:hypothetical protein